MGPAKPARWSGGFGYSCVFFKSGHHFGIKIFLGYIFDKDSQATAHVTASGGKRSKRWREEEGRAPEGGG